MTLTNLLMMPTPNFGTKALLVVAVVRKDEVYFRKFVRLRQTKVLDNTYIFKLRVISVILFVLPLCSQHVERTVVVERPLLQFPSSHLVELNITSLHF